jgi:Helix-turn-helix domain
MTNSNNTATETQRPARQGRDGAHGFRHAVYATCNPAWHAQQAMLQGYNEARRRRLSHREARWIEHLHRSGQTLKQIGATLRINRSIIPRELRVHGIVLTPHASIMTQRMSLLDAEVEQIQTMLKQGRNMEYIAEEICVCRTVITRELRAKGIPTRPERRRRAAKKSISGWWGKLGDDPDTYRKVKD